MGEEGVIEMPQHLIDHLEGKESDTLRDKTKFLSIAVELGYITEKLRKAILKLQKQKQNEGKNFTVGYILENHPKIKLSQEKIDKITKKQKKLWREREIIKHRRKESRIRLKYLLDNAEKEAIIVNIHLGNPNLIFQGSLDDFTPSGIGIISKKPLKIGIVVNLSFKIGNDSFHLEAIIVNKNNNGTRFGAKFIKVKDDVRKLLNSAYGSSKLGRGAR